MEVNGGRTGFFVHLFVHSFVSSAGLLTGSLAHSPPARPTTGSLATGLRSLLPAANFPTVFFFPREYRFSTSRFSFLSNSMAALLTR